METIDDWLGEPLSVVRSRGAGRVPYVLDWRRNVIGLPGDGECSAALDRQIRSYVARPDWFADSDAARLSERLGRISKFQSLRSEDALTWSWFGTLAGFPPAVRQQAAQWLYDQLDLNQSTSSEVEIRLWERVHHPNAPRAPGPEVDAIIDDPGGALIYVEAKWLADLGTGRGAGEESQDDQIVLRRDSLRTDPRLRGDTRSFAVLGLGADRADRQAYGETDQSLRAVTICWLGWDDLASCEAHPHAEEFGRYLAWKRSI